MALLTALRALLLTALRALPFLTVGIGMGTAHADGRDCGADRTPRVTFIQFQSLNLETMPPSMLTIKGKLSMPGKADERWHCQNDDHRGKGNKLKDKDKDKDKRKLSAVLILHGSGGIDARGDFYEAALNEAGIATLQIDMWEARGVTGLANRPPLPILTIPDAFSALAFLSANPAIDPDHIGILGFSWGGVMSLAAAEQAYVAQFSRGLRFAAHVAHYPVCYGANNANILTAFNTTPAQAGTRFLTLTGAPVLIQIGSEDDYDNSAAPCRTLAQVVNPTNNNVVEVAEYVGAYHGWDRLMVPVTVADPFADQGRCLLGPCLEFPQVVIKPDVAQAYESRERVVRFFRRKL